MGWDIEHQGRGEVRGDIGVGIDISGSIDVNNEWF
jgi:hypothetical protein